MRVWDLRRVIGIGRFVIRIVILWLGRHERWIIFVIYEYADEVISIRVESIFALPGRLVFFRGEVLVVRMRDEGGGGTVGLVFSLKSIQWVDCFMKKRSTRNLRIPNEGVSERRAKRGPS